MATKKNRSRKPKTTMKDKTDAALRELTEKVIEAIEANPGNWTKPWRETLASGLPTNALTKRRYSGGNLFWLTLTTQGRGYSTNFWATYKQWSELGCQVRKGETSTLGMFYKRLTITEEVDGQDKTKTIPLLRGFYLFNADQVEGGVEKVAERFGADEDPSEVDIIDHAEEFFTAIGAELRHGGDRAFFVPALDYIQVPVRDSFVTSEAYYATLAHEHVHWSGHPSRLDRTKGKHFGDETYAREELVAELGSAFVLGYLGIDTDAEGCGNAAYLASWLKVLKEEPRALWSVMGDAARALDLLVHEAGENGATLEDEDKMEVAA